MSWADVVTFTAGIDTGTSGSNQNADQLTKDGITIYGTSMATTTEQYRMYSGSTVTVSSTVGNITKIVVTSTAKKGSTYGPDCLKTNDSSYKTTADSNIGTWTGNAESVEFNLSGQCRATSIEVTYTSSGGDTPVSPSVTLSPTTINAPSGEADGIIEVSLANFTDTPQLSLSVYDANEDEVDWMIADLDDNDNVEYLIETNDGAARIAYLKVIAIENGNNYYSNTVTISQAEYVAPTPPADLPFEWAGGSSADFDALKGTTISGLGSDYAEDNHNPYLMKLDSNGDFIQVKCDQRPYNVTIGVKMIGGNALSTITVQGSADGVTFTKVEELTISGAQNSIHTLKTTKPFDVDDRYVRLLFTKGSNVGVGPITIKKYPEKYTLTVGNLENVELFVFDAADDSNPMIENGGVGSAQVYDGTDVQLSVSSLAGYTLQSLVVDGNDVTSEIEDGKYTFTMPKRDVTVTATAVNLPNGITFGSAQGSTKINDTSITAHDSEGNTWSITTEGTASFTQNASYSQVGSSSKPATSITFTTTLQQECTITEFSAKFGGNSGTTGNITLKVGNTTVGSGSLNAANDVVVSSTSGASGTVLTVTITNIDKGVKCYYISYKTMPSQATKTVSSYGWATYIPEFNVKFDEGDAWVVENATTEGVISLVEVSSVPAGTPVLLKGAGTKTMNVVTTATAPATNLLSVCDGSANGELVPWVLAKDGDGAAFMEWTGNVSDLQGRVVLWLDFSNDGLTGSTRTLSLDADGTQGISNIDHSTLTINHYYDLQGRHVAQPTKGLYIVNGKKVIIK